MQNGILSGAMSAMREVLASAGIFVALTKLAFLSRKCYQDWALHPKTHAFCCAVKKNSAELLSKLACSDDRIMSSVLSSIY